MDGFSLKDAGDFDIKGIGLNFRYRFQGIKKKKERCLFESSWQGLLGSGYNELHVREQDTVYEELDKRWQELDDHIGKLF